MPGAKSRKTSKPPGSKPPNSREAEFISCLFVESPVGVLSTFWLCGQDLGRALLRVPWLVRSSKLPGASLNAQFSPKGNEQGMGTLPKHGTCTEGTKKEKALPGMLWRFFLFAFGSVVVTLFADPCLTSSCTTLPKQMDPFDLLVSHVGCLVNVLKA